MRILFVSIVSSRRPQDMSSRLLQYMSSRRLQDMPPRRVFKTSWRHIFKTSSRHVFKTSSRRLQRNNFSSSKTSSRSLGRCKIVVLKTCWRRLQDVFKTNRCLLGRPRTRDMWEGFWYYISHCLDFFCRNGFCRIEIFMKKNFFKVTIVISFDSTDLRKDSTLAK